MRSMALVLVLAACSGPARSTLPGQIPAVAPAHDLAVAKDMAPKADPKDTRLEAKDPRVVDLDIIRITANMKGVGEYDMSSVATPDIFKSANEASKAGETERAISLYRRIVAEFPESQFAPVSLFNIAAIYDRRADLGAPI